MQACWSAIHWAALAEEVAAADYYFFCPIGQPPSLRLL